MSRVPLKPGNVVVVCALNELSRWVNSSGKLGPRDRDRAIELFRILRKEEENFDAMEVRAYLLSALQWSSAAANDVSEIAAKTLDGRSLRRTQTVKSWPRDSLKRWRSS